MSDRPPRGFLALLVGQVVSITGDRFHYLALVALLTAHAARHATPSAPLLAALAWAMLGPTLVVAPWAGAIVDRLPLVRVLVVSDALRAAIVALVPFAYLATGSTVPVLVLVALAFVLNCFFLPARSALPPRLVAPEALDRANAALVLGGIAATLLGTVVGGPVVDRFGPAPALWFDALTYGVSVVALATLWRAPLAPPPPAKDAPRGTFAEARAGWTVLAARPASRAPVAAAVATWVAGGALHVAGTAHVQRGTTAVSGIGFLLGAMAVGAAVGAAIALKRPASDATRALGEGLLGAGAGLAAFALAPPGAWTLVAAAVTGFFAAPVFFRSETAIQRAVEDGLRARLFSVRDFLSRAAFLVTSALIAPWVVRAGTTPPLVGAGAFLVVLGAGLVWTATKTRASG